MDHDTLDRLRQSHPAWQVLRVDHAPLILSFLFLAFVHPNRRAVPAPELTAHLDAYLDQLRETDAARYPRRARDYLEDWSAPNRAFLRKYYPRSGVDAEFDLTPATEQAIEWLRSLAPQQFIGTESRLIALFQLLRDLAVGSQDDPAGRAKDLERRRDELDREIERVRSGRAGPLDTHQTLLVHRTLWTEEPSQGRSLRDLPALGDHEQSLFDDLRFDRLGERVRLEQEKIGFTLVEAAVRDL
jgi:hypothetical protein